MKYPFGLGVALAVAGLFVAVSAAGAAPLYSDPLGDTFGPGPDVVSYAGDLTTVPGHVYFAVNFSGPVAPASADLPHSVLGYLDLDTDKDAATGGDATFGDPVPGGNSWINYGIANSFVPGPQIGLGDEYYVSLFSEADHPGLVDVFSAATNQSVGAVPIAFGPTGFSLAIPLAMLGNPADPFFHFGGLVGSFGGASDRFPNGATAAVVTPEPSGVVLFGAAGLAAWGFLRRRKAAR